MSATEVGQYALLLFKSWLMGKDASLPDDLDFLAVVARGPVSNLVLQKFPVVETKIGPRRRNDVLYKEWITVMERYETASESGKKGADVRWGAYSHPINESIAQTNPNQSEPNQTNPNQTKVNPPELFQQAKRVYRRHVGKNFGSLGNNAGRWDELCRKHGNLVVPAVEIYASELGRNGKNLNYPIAHFLKNAQEFIEAADRNQSDSVHKMNLESEVTDSVVRMDSEIEADRIKFQAELEEKRKQREYDLAHAGEF